MKKLIRFIYYYYFFFVFSRTYQGKIIFKNFVLHFLYTALPIFLVEKDKKEIKDFWYNITRSNQFLSYYTDFETSSEHLLILSLRNQLVLKGKKTGWCFFNDFLLFLKFNYALSGINLLLDNFLDSMTLPYKLYLVKFSNRNYYFPGPILIESEQLAFMRKAFSTGVRKQHDIKYINRFFLETIAFLNKSSDSILLQILNNIIDQGMENRAFIHYRWRLHKKS